MYRPLESLRDVQGCISQAFGRRMVLFLRCERSYDGEERANDCL